MRALANKRLFGVVFAGVRDPKTAFDRFWETGVTPEPVNPVRVATALRDEAVFQAAYGHLTGWRSLRQRLSPRWSRKRSGCRRRWWRLRRR